MVCSKGAGKRHQQTVATGNVIQIGNRCRAVAVARRRSQHNRRNAAAGQVDRAAVGAAVAEHILLQADIVRTRDVSDMLRLQVLDLFRKPIYLVRLLDTLNSLFPLTKPDR